MSKAEKPHFYGHRQRLKQKFMHSSSTSSLADYELIELLLFSAVPRKDVKPLAKYLLNTFGSLSSILYCDKERLLKLPDVTESIYIQFSVVRELIQRVMQGKVMNKNIISSWNTLIDYLKVTIGHIKLEEFRILFLNKKNILIADEIQAKGTVDQTPIYPREVVKRALFYEASAIIMVHNHPSGNPTPSKADIQLTQKIVVACETMNVAVHDHIIICANDFYSFKTNGLL